MKRLLLMLFMVLAFCTSGCTTKVAQPVVNFDGKVFELKYSAKTYGKLTYLNEYYKRDEKYDNWTELIGVDHFPNEKSPIAYANKLRTQVLAAGDLAQPVRSIAPNGVILAFIVSGGKMPTDFELNIFKCEQSPKGGTVILQYARRYFVSNTKDIDKVLDDVEANGERWAALLANTPIPATVEKDIDLGK